jgi:hypothetical protein
MYHAINCWQLKRISRLPSLASGNAREYFERAVVDHLMELGKQGLSSLSADRLPARVMITVFARDLKSLIAWLMSSFGPAARIPWLLHRCPPGNTVVVI